MVVCWLPWWGDVPVRPVGPQHIVRGHWGHVAESTISWSFNSHLRQEFHHDRKGIHDVRVGHYLPSVAVRCRGSHPRTHHSTSCKKAEKGPWDHPGTVYTLSVYYSVHAIYMFHKNRRSTLKGRNVVLFLYWIF